LLRASRRLARRCRSPGFSGRRCRGSPQVFGRAAVKRRERASATAAQRAALAVLLAAALALEALYAANMVAWRRAPDRGWVGSAETGPHVVAATRPEGEEAGLRAGDQILAINGGGYATYREMLSRLRLERGSTNDYTVRRGSETLDVAVPTHPIGLRI